VGGEFDGLEQLVGSARSEIERDLVDAEPLVSGELGRDLVRRSL
jgi:hypothetical protein